MLSNKARMSRTHRSIHSVSVCWNSSSFVHLLRMPPPPALRKPPCISTTYRTPSFITIDRRPFGVPVCGIRINLHPSVPQVHTSAAVLWISRSAIMLDGMTHMVNYKREFRRNADFTHTYTGPGGSVCLGGIMGWWFLCFRPLCLQIFQSVQK